MAVNYIQGAQYKFYLILLLIILLLCGDIESNPGPSRATTRSARILYANVNGLSKKMEELRAASTRHDILFCSETRVTNKRCPGALKINGFSGPHQRLHKSSPNAQGMAMYIREGYCAYRQSQCECNCHEVQVVRVCSRLNNFYIYSFYRNPHHDDSIYDCMLDSMSLTQISDSKAVFIFVGDANAHHREWLGSSTRTDNHGLNAHLFCTQSGSQQLVMGPTRYNPDNCLDLVMTNVPDVVSVAVGAPIGLTSDHSHLSIRVAVQQVVPQYTMRKKNPP